MRALAYYTTYEEANERQLDLLAAGIDAKIEFVPSNHLPGLSSGTGLYHLCAFPEDAEKALELIAIPADTKVKSIAACPRCASSDVRPAETPALIDLSLFMLPSIIDFIKSKTSGERYRCESCKNTYRLKIGG